MPKYKTVQPSDERWNELAAGMNAGEAAAEYPAVLSPEEIARLQQAHNLQYPQVTDTPTPTTVPTPTPTHMQPLYISPGKLEELIKAVIEEQNTRPSNYFTHEFIIHESIKPEELKIESKIRLSEFMKNLQNPLFTDIMSGGKSGME